MFSERNHVKVFVSSTVYDFESQLDVVYSTLDGYGYDVLMSHKGTVPVDSKVSNLENCLKGVENCDVFLGFIRPLSGTGILKPGEKSITAQEFDVAFRVGMPRFVLADYRVVFARQFTNMMKIPIGDIPNYVEKARSDGSMVERPNRVIHSESIELYNIAIKNNTLPISRKGNWVQEYKNLQDVMLHVEAQFKDVFSSWEKSICLDAEWDDLDAKLMQNVIDEGLASGRLNVSNATPERLLGHLQLTDAPYVKNGAMALFGLETHRFLPQSKMRIQVMLGGKTADQYEDSLVLEGNLMELSNQAKDYFKRRLPMVSEFHREEWDRKDYIEYPQAVLDEAVTNALIHRDMSDTTGEVIVFLYADKIEIINPGTMPDNLVKRKNKVLSHVSSPRNPLMAEVFYIDGKMEKTGRGLKLIHDQMNELKRKLPEWECIEGKTKLTIYRVPNVVRLNDRVTKFLSTKKEGDSFSKQDYLEYWNHKISDGTAKNDLQSMVNGALCKQEGSGPTTKYIVISTNL